MTHLNYSQAMALADALDCTPEIIATNGMTGQVHLMLPRLSAADATAFIKDCLAGTNVLPASITITDDTVEGSAMPCALVVIHTEE